MVHECAVSASFGLDEVGRDFMWEANASFEDAGNGDMEDGEGEYNGPGLDGSPIAEAAAPDNRRKRRS